MITGTSDIYTVYAEAENMTFIMKDHYIFSRDGDGDPEKILESTEVIGFHYGEPTATSTQNPRLKAEY